MMSVIVMVSFLYLLHIIAQIIASITNDYCRQRRFERESLSHRRTRIDTEALLDEEDEDEFVEDWDNVPPWNSNLPLRSVVGEDSNVYILLNGLDTRITLQHRPVLEGSLLGSIYVRDTLLQTFSVNAMGNVRLIDVVDSPPVKVVSLLFQPRTGLIILQWNDNPGSHHITSCYEYLTEFADPGAIKPDWTKEGF